MAGILKIEDPRFLHFRQKRTSLWLAGMTQSIEEIFDEMALSVEKFKGLNYEKLSTGGDDIRVFTAPMIPKLTQDSGLIFHKEKEPV